MGLGQINTNLSALKAYNQLTNVNNTLTKHQERISTGKRVNRASDDPAGYYIARIYERDISVINRNIAHVENASAELQAQDSKMASMVTLLQKIEDLTLQAKSELVTTAQKSALKQEIDQLVLEISSVVSGLKSLSGGVGGSGINVGAGLDINLLTPTMDGDALVSGAGLGLQLASGGIAISVSTASAVDSSLSILSAAITKMLQNEEKIGAYISRLQSKGDAFAVDVINKQAQKSVIEDADLAFEQLQVTKFQILQQSALSMLAQANVAPQAVLQLIAG